MECQSGVRSGAAPASISAADISACLPGSVSRGPLVTEHPREVSPRSRRGDVVRGRIHPRSDRLPSGVRFLPHPSSAAPSASFAVSLPSRGGQRGYFVHLFDHSGVRSCLSAGGAPSAPGELVAPGPDHVPFGPSLTASWACLDLRPLSALHLGGPAPDGWPPTAVMLAVTVSARASTADPLIEVTLSPRLRTAPLPVRPAGVADRWRNIGSCQKPPWHNALQVEKMRRIAHKRIEVLRMKGRRSAALLGTGRTPGDAALQATPSPPGRDEFRHPVFASARPSFRRPHGAVRCFGRSDRSE